MSSLEQKNDDQGSENPRFVFYDRSTVSLSQRLRLYPRSEVHTLHAEETTLHEYRHRIQHYQDTLPSSKNWEYYKKIVNPYEFVYTQKKYDHFPDSVCSLRPLSRSYFKMVEILHQLRFFEPLMASSVTHIKTAHVCEGPGGFIEAIFDEAAQNGMAVQVSVAMTLASKNCTVPGWKRAAQFLKHHRNIKVIYGDDHTGDIMKPENQQAFIEYATHPYYGGKVHLFTADGGFDFSKDYAKQEPMIFPLLLASTKIGLEVLALGGTFVLKIFDFYYPSTQDLLYFLSCHFEKWTLYKPDMSRPCNPEHYFIGTGFIGCTEEVLDSMRLWCSMVESGEPLDSLLTMSYPDAFRHQLREKQSQSFTKQIHYLERVFHLIDHPDEDRLRECLVENERASHQWCRIHGVPISERAAESQSDPPVFCPQ